jgi:hypothetical protein
MLKPCLSSTARDKDSGLPEQQHLVTQTDVQVYLQPEAATALEDKELDAQVNEDGEVSFLLQPQA